MKTPVQNINIGDMIEFVDCDEPQEVVGITRGHDIWRFTFDDGFVMTCYEGETLCVL